MVLTYTIVKEIPEYFIHKELKDQIEMFVRLYSITKYT